MVLETQPESGDQARELSSALREHREEILSRWAVRCREISKARPLTNDQLLDHLPRLLDRLAAAVESATEGGTVVAPVKESRAHALHRLDVGFDLRDITQEYALLRKVLFGVLHQYAPRLLVRGFDLVASAIDDCLAESVDYYVRVRHRTLEALDQVAQVVTGPGEADGMLRRLLEVAMQTIPSVDAVTLLVRDGQRLTVKEAIGVTAERDRSLSVEVGEGFSGTVAATRQPLFLAAASGSPMLRSEFLHRKNVKAMYGVPMIRGDDLLGVAHIASLTSHEFADEDQLLFRTVTERAASVIAQARMMEQLRRAIDFRERLMGIVSHDLRSPLHTIAMTTRLVLARDDAPTWARTSSQRVMRSVDRMTRMVSDLLDFTRVQAHTGLPIARRRIDACLLVQETLEELEIVHPHRISPRLHCARALGLWDPDRLVQVLTNLINNALEHGDPSAPIVVDLDDDETEVRLAVTNRGETIPPERLSTLFDPFHRDRDQTRGGGLGLGLHIVGEVAKAHGGGVSVDSEDGVTRFTVRLPKEPPPPAGD